jgi:hypothetical protein
MPRSAQTLSLKARSVQLTGHSDHLLFRVLERDYPAWPSNVHRNAPGFRRLNKVARI